MLFFRLGIINLVLGLLLTSSPAWSRRCLQLFDMPGMARVRAFKLPDLPPPEIAQVITAIPPKNRAEMREPGARFILSQTIELSKASPENVREFFNQFPQTEYGENSVIHALHAQTAFLTGIPPDEVITYFENFPSGIKPGKAGHALMAQSALVYGLDPQWVTDYVQSFPRIYRLKGTFEHGIIMQTAMVTGAPPRQVTQFFRQFDVFRLSVRPQLAALISQWRFFAERSNQ